MDPKIKQQWVEALRSGKYKQGRAVLRSQENQFCCLGVLCDVIDPNGWGNSVRNFSALDFRGQTYNLSLNMRAKLKIDCGNEKILIKLNDRGAPFDEIAQYIEDHL